MLHSHNHSCVCDHENVKYCKHCYTVYCLNCSQEWNTKVSWSNTTYPWYGYQGIRSGGGQFLGNAGGGLPNETVTPTTTCKHGE